MLKEIFSVLNSFLSGLYNLYIYLHIFPETIHSESTIYQYIVKYIKMNSESRLFHILAGLWRLLQVGTLFGSPCLITIIRVGDLFIVTSAFRDM